MSCGWEAVDDAGRNPSNGNSENRSLSRARLEIQLLAFCEKLSRNSLAAQFVPIISDPCPVGLVILRNETIDKEKGQFSILRCRSCLQALTRCSDGAIEILTIERLRPRWQAQQKRAQRKQCEDRK